MKRKNPELHEKQEEINALEKRIKDLASRMISDEAYFEGLKSRIKAIKENEKDAEDKLAKLEVKIQREKEAFLAYKKIELEEISQKHIALCALQDKIEAQNTDSDARAKKLDALSRQLHIEANKLTEDKRDIAKQQQEFREKSISLKLKENGLQKEKEINERQSGFLAQTEADLYRQREKINNQLKSLSEKLVEVSSERKSNALRSSELTALRQDLNQQRIEQDEKEIYLKSETKKLEALYNSTNELLREQERKEKSNKEALETMKDYENELELKRLTLLSEARKKQVKLRIEKLRK